MISRVVGALWLIVNGILFCIPIIVHICIACSVSLTDLMTYIGKPAMSVIGLVSIGLGVWGLVAARRSAALGVDARGT
jgi:hypothetical protein